MLFIVISNLFEHTPFFHFTVEPLRKLPCFLQTENQDLDPSCGSISSTFIFARSCLSCAWISAFFSDNNLGLTIGFSLSAVIACCTRNSALIIWPTASCSPRGSMLEVTADVAANLHREEDGGSTRGYVRANVVAQQRRTCDDT